MNCFRQGQRWVSSFAVAVLLISSAAAQNATNLSRLKPLSVPAAIMPPPSPIGYFRNLLAMSPQQRQIALAKKSPDFRQRILIKVTEYTALDPSQRELRLRVTELRWFLMPLLRASPDARNARLALVPDNLRDMVSLRLHQWEILPPALQQEFLENENILGYFSQVNTTNNIADGAVPSAVEKSRWDSLPNGQRTAMITQFNQFFELSSSEKQKALGGLSGLEQVQMQKTLDTFDKLPPPERIECIHAFGKFADMAPQERAEFLENAQRWSQMTPAERKAWSDLVSHVPQWKPLPPTAIMPPPPQIPKNLHPVVVTNRD